MPTHGETSRGADREEVVALALEMIPDELLAAPPAGLRGPTPEQEADGSVRALGMRLDVSTERVFLDGASVPVSIEYHGSATGDDLLGPEIDVRVEVRNGVPCLVDLRLSIRHLGPGMDQSHIANLDVAELVEILVEATSARLRVDDQGVPLGIEREIPPMESITKIMAALHRMQQGPRSRYISREFLEQVAAVYRENVEGSPTKAVREKFMVGGRTAAGYVQRARAEGLLPPTTRGRRQA